MSETDLTVINAALTRVGSEPISTLESSGAGPSISANNYEILVKAELAAHPWKRALKIGQLSRLDEDIEGDPPEPWTAAYQLPDDLVEIVTVKIGGAVIDYAWHGDTLLCDAAEADEVILHYVWRIAEADWPPWFKLGMIYRLEAMFLRGIPMLYREAAARDEQAEFQFAKARNRDSQGQTPRQPMPSPTLAARSGSTPLRNAAISRG